MGLWQFALTTPALDYSDRDVVAKMASRVVTASKTTLREVHAVFPARAVLLVHSIACSATRVV
jgi:hypothetical protein